MGRKNSQQMIDGMKGQGVFKPPMTGTTGITSKVPKVGLLGTQPLSFSNPNNPSIYAGSIGGPSKVGTAGAPVGTVYVGGTSLN